jgi:methylenetetrahydrofolate reductase (NADPH)
LIDELITRIENNDDLTYHATNKKGELKTNTRDSPNALTWGIFAGREIIQPTIVETVSFLAWKDEAYLLGEHWSKCYNAASPSRKLIHDMMDDWYLVNIVDNDFHRSNAVFELFNDLEITDFNAEIEVPAKPETNGTAEPNGVAAN